MQNETLDLIKTNQEAQNAINLQNFNLVGDLTGWRKLKNNQRREQILKGYSKILRLVARGIR